MKITKWLKGRKRIRIMCRIIKDLGRLQIEDLKEMADYADALHSSEVYQQKKAARR